MQPDAHNISFMVVVAASGLKLFWIESWRAEFKGVLNTKILDQSHLLAP